MPLPGASNKPPNSICFVNGQNEVIQMIRQAISEPGGSVNSSTASVITMAASQQKGQQPTYITTQARLLSTPQIQRIQAIASPKPGQRGPQIVAISIPSNKINPQRVDQSILPKTIPMSPQSPVVLSTPQRISAQLGVPTIATPKNYISPILDHSGSRKRQDVDCDYSLESKRRKAEKVGKGLRHFSMKVCEKVQRKGTTSYNEVADELVAEFSNCSNLPVSTADQYDQKNIRRRVYDALNVLMAMNIISKEKKEIKWLGLPANSLQECHTLEKEKKQRMEQIRTKTCHLNDLIIQQIAFKNLVERNRDLETKYSCPPAPSSCIQLPFIVVSTDKKTVIDCSISKDKTEYLFNFDNTFEIHDDVEVLKRMGMDLGLNKGVINEDALERVKTMVPKSLEKYVYNLATGNSEPEICLQMEAEMASSSAAGSVDVLCDEDTSSDNITMITQGAANHYSTEAGSPSSSCEFSDNDSEYSEDVEVN